MTALLNDRGEPIHRRHIAECRAILAAIKAGHTEHTRTDGPITGHTHPQPPTPEDDD